MTNQLERLRDAKKHLLIEELSLRSKGQESRAKLLDQFTLLIPTLIITASGFIIRSTYDKNSVHIVVFALLLLSGAGYVWTCHIINLNKRVGCHIRKLGEWLSSLPTMSSDEVAEIKFFENLEHSDPIEKLCMLNPFKLDHRLVWFIPFALAVFLEPQLLSSIL